VNNSRLVVAIVLLLSVIAACNRPVEVQPPTVAPYGMKELYVRDPDGYMPCFQWPAN
jgi:hypothetical protein